MTALSNLLTLIRSEEAPEGYGQVYGGSPVQADVSKKTLNEVKAFQTLMLARGSKSSACGGYQFIKATLAATIAQMKLTGNEVWVPSLQDRMALHLMNGRGYQSYLTGKLSAEAFANNLAKEWASLPVVSAIKGSQGKTLKPGQSYYDGDGLNSAHHDPKVFLAAVVALKKDGVVALPPVPTVPPKAPEVVTPPQPEKKGLLAALLRLLSLIFKKGN
jgi:muramidase (phage lysozyme)